MGLSTEYFQQQPTTANWVISLGANTNTNIRPPNNISWARGSLSKGFMEASEEHSLYGPLIIWRDFAVRSGVFIQSTLDRTPSIAYDNHPRTNPHCVSVFLPYSHESISKIQSRGTISAQLELRARSNTKTSTPKSKTFIRCHPLGVYIKSSQQPDTRRPLA